ncbi:xanthine dehydrogenase accessory protein XdhC [Roseicyclus persicicus]|uniref:Xanthine dehydrogenase accessory protein XdhC n=1 Tax=Roseicyclus persicicus TaxID=2650661 RepID=A0A7X6GXC0_9RHOB|nr:xanthine dehydrogenase accessory protein XdhC [Roseibacterium persicicum]NKX44132.1 xanthine dehydrogenase accessory protein XdhC [Roseibacterium persicicum]
MSGIRVTIMAVQGSAPREAGTAMLVRADGIAGTIGGGALEWEAMRIGRQMLADGKAYAEHRIPLGPSLGQCCGGAVTLRFEAVETLDRPRGADLWVWGAGHVGRAVVAVLAPLPHVAITWADTGRARFPDSVPEGVETLPAADLPRLMAHAPDHAHHLILTYSHDIDLALCHAALTRGFASCGLIGSATKWARFRSRLAALGHSDAEISRIDCPIGDPGLGKHPQAIAVGVAARLLKEHLHKESAAKPIHRGKVTSP